MWGFMKKTIFIFLTIAAMSTIDTRGSSYERYQKEQEGRRQVQEYMEREQAKANQEQVERVFQRMQQDHVISAAKGESRLGSGFQH